MSAPPPPRGKDSSPLKASYAEPQRPEPTALQSGLAGNASSTATLRPEGAPGLQAIPKKKRNHRGGKKKRARKQSFAPSTEDGSEMPETSQSQRGGSSESAARASFYRLHGRNLSNTSIESEALLDHRYVPQISCNFIQVTRCLQRSAKYETPKSFNHGSECLRSSLIRQPVNISTTISKSICF